MIWFYYSYTCPSQYRQRIKYSTYSILSQKPVRANAKKCVQIKYSSQARQGDRSPQDSGDSHLWGQEGKLLSAQSSTSLFSLKFIVKCPLII